MQYFGVLLRITPGKYQGSISQDTILQLEPMLLHVTHCPLCCSATSGQR
jgi:hypothetical protein